MPHFAIKSDYYDLFMEKKENIFPRFLNILRKYTKPDIEKLFQTNQFLGLALRKQWKQLDEMEKDNTKQLIHRLGLEYISKFFAI